MTTADDARHEPLDDRPVRRAAVAGALTVLGLLAAHLAAAAGAGVQDGGPASVPWARALGGGLLFGAAVAAWRIRSLTPPRRGLAVGLLLVMVAAVALRWSAAGLAVSMPVWAALASALVLVAAAGALLTVEVPEARGPRRVGRGDVIGWATLLLFVLAAFAYGWLRAR